MKKIAAIILAVMAVLFIVSGIESRNYAELHRSVADLNTSVATLCYRSAERERDLASERVKESQKLENDAVQAAAGGDSIRASHYRLRARYYEMWFFKYHTHEATYQQHTGESYQAQAELQTASAEFREGTAKFFFAGAIAFAGLGLVLTCTAFRKSQ